MHAGPVEIPGRTSSSPQLPAPRPALTPRAAPYPSSQHSVKSGKKEAVHLPYKSAQPDFADAASHGGSQGTRAIET